MGTSLQHGQHLRRECLVQLDEIEIADRTSPVRASSFPIAGTGPMPMIRGSTPVVAQASMRASAARRDAPPRLAAISTSAAPPSVMPDADPALMMPGCPSTSGNTSGSLRRLSIVVPARGCSSTSRSTGLALRVVAWRGNDLVAETPGGDRRLGALLTLERVRVRRVARDPVLSRARTSAVWPMISPDNAHEEPVAVHRVDERKFPILWPQRASSLSTRYGIRLIDSMPPASTTRDWPAEDGLRAQRDCLQAGRTRLVHGVGRHFVRKTRATRDLPGRIRARPGLPRMTDDHFVDVAGARRRRAPAPRRAARAPSSAGCVCAKRAAVTADRRTRGSRNDDVCAHAGMIRRYKTTPDVSDDIRRGIREEVGYRPIFDVPPPLAMAISLSISSGEIVNETLTVLPVPVTCSALSMASTCGS